MSAETGTPEPSTDRKASTPTGGGARRSRPWGVVALALVALLTLMAYQWGFPPLGMDAGNDDADGEDAVVAVETANARILPVDETLTVPGELRGFEYTRLGFQVEGYVHEMHFEEGDAVEQGDILATLDKRDFRLALQQAEATLEQVRAGLGMAGGDTRVPAPDETGTVRRARAALEGEERNVRRIRELAEIESATPSELDAAETAYDVARHAYQEAMENARERIGLLAVREAALAQARQNIEHASLRAPFSGGVWQKLSGPGEYLEVGDPVYALVHTDTLRLRLDVPERDARRVKLGQEVRFRFFDEDGPHTATITRILPQLDETTRVMIVEAEVDNPGGWRPGEFVTARIVAAEGVPMVTVPASAVSSFVGIHRVFVVEDGVAEAREVVLGQTVDERVVVRDGLEGDEEVVLEPGPLRSGARVEVMPGDGP